MDPVRNPFSPGAGNPPPELAGRTEIIEQIDVSLKRVAQKRPIKFPIMVGLRGVGKTVLLVKAREIAETDGFIAIDIEAHEGKSLPQLLAPGIRKAIITLSRVEQAKEKGRYALSVFKSFLSSVSISFGEIEISMSSEPAIGTADSGDLEADLPELILALGEAAKAADRPVVFLIDELQYLSTVEFSALIMAMHKVNQRSLPVALIGAGLPQILGLAGNSKSYAERLFAYPTVGSLEDLDARNAIINPAKTEGCSFDPDAVTEILSVTERYPYFLQQWGYDAWNLANGPTITKRDIEEATTKSLAALDEGFFRVRYDRCTPSEKKYMRALAELGVGQHRSSDVADKLGIKSTSVAPTRSSLIKKGMIYSPSYGDTSFTVPMFDDYMRRTMPKFEKHRLASWDTNDI